MVKFLNVSGISECFVEDGSITLWRFSRGWWNFWTFVTFVKVFLKMGQFLNICEGFLEDRQFVNNSGICECLLEDIWVSHTFLEDGCIYERSWHFWMFCRGWVNFLLCEGFLEDGWISERLWHLWRFFKTWVNFWTFLAFVNFH